jgi:hypothetical protein
MTSGSFLVWPPEACANARYRRSDAKELERAGGLLGCSATLVRMREAHSIFLVLVCRLQTSFDWRC